MKINKASGPSGIVADILKAAGEAGLAWTAHVCKAVVKEGRMPEDWCHSWMINVYKGKGNVMECGSYLGIRLPEIEVLLCKCNFIYKTCTQFLSK